jgi:hypothetical protein
MATAPATIIEEPAGELEPAPAAAPAPAPAAAPASAAPAPEPAASEPPAPANDDWRARLSGGDDKLLGYLARVPSEKALVERVKRHEDDLKAGKYVKPLPDNPTDEEVAAHRKAQGVPDKPEAYLTSLPDGLVVGEADKPFVDQFLTNMHGAGAPPALVNAALETYYGIVEEQAAAESQAANEAKNASIEALREEWGADYKRNLNVMTAHLDTLPPAVAEAFKFGKGADGLPLGYNADVLKWLTAQALETNPLATVVPGAGANQASAIADEIKTIDDFMRTNRAAYNKDEKMQARYRELVDARSRLEAKG